MHYILYLAHSNEGYINECRFSLLKYLSVYNLKPPTDTAVVIYTDKPALFENFIPFFTHFHLEEITSATVKDWQEGTGYVHRAKPKMIQDFFTKYKGDLIFFDTDTYITTPIEPLWNDMENGIIYMHQSEGIIDQTKNPEFKKWDNFLQKANLDYGNKKFEYVPHFQIWNSGVLGLKASLAPVIEDVLLLIDSIYKQFPKHIAEQVACSYCLQNHGTIKSAKEHVAHYWNLKEFRALLRSFFKKNEEESIPNLVKAVHKLDAKQMEREKEAYDDLPLWKRLMATLSGTNWNIKKYEKKI
ncbi:MAG TPA: hypothetical protein VM888_02225 [Chitinophagaceae bacterium]|jgi:hypothetical protein|nr:hypothetical protein [Chitinophagaceae bacterium]